MKAIIAISFFLSGFPAFAVVGGTAANDSVIQNTFGISLENHRSTDTPEIPIGPRIAITCGHCAQHIYTYPDLLQSSSDQTNQAYDVLQSGTFGLPFFEKANYSYDLALIILDPADRYSGPYVSISKTKVQLHETLTILGMGKNTSSRTSLCDGFSEAAKFAYAPFQVIDFYSQGVGFILTGQPAATCWGDSGGYYFRTLADQTVELVGINSWGTEGGLQENPQDGVVKNYQGYLSGANDLTSSGIQSWLAKVAADKNIDICGVTKSCPPIRSPLLKETP